MAPSALLTADCFMSRRLQLIALLEAISHGRGDLPLDLFDAETVAWAVQTGMGPLFYRAIKENPENSASPQRQVLKAADLTARLLVGSQLEAMEEIVDACGGQVPPLTLLKGISVAEQYYPEPHLRLMRDLDFLVHRESLPLVKSILEKLGYRQRYDDSLYEDHHHVAPFFHEDKQVWIEVHHALFSPKKRAGEVGLFQRENLFNQVGSSRFRGREVCRLSAQLQLVYLAAHWAQDFKRVGAVLALVDAIYLLQRAEDELSWEWILKSVHGSVAAAYLYLLLSYLDRNRLVSIAPEILQNLFLSQPSFGRISLGAAHAMIDHYFLAGNVFGRLLSERNVAVIWNTLSRPASALPNLVLVPVNLSLPYHYRIH
jgi:Uncharacterised nucleotidyltransferase